MKDWSIRQRVVASFAGILVIMALTSAAAFLYLQRIEAAAHAISVDAMPGLISSSELLANTYSNHTRVVRHASLESKSELEQNEAQILANRVREQALMSKYDATINAADDRATFDAFKPLLSAYWATQDRLLKMAPIAGQGLSDRRSFVAAELEPRFDKVRTALEGIVDWNERYNTASVEKIQTSVSEARNGIMASMVVVIVLVFVSGYFLLGAINEPLQRLVGALDVMRQGNFTSRLERLRRDEFGLVSDGFNRMSDELAALVGQVQKSALQVTTSVTEVAANSKQQQATAHEIAATTAEIGATSKEISATSQQLVKTISEVSAGAEQSASLAGNGRTGLLQMAETMQHVMDATGSINAKLVVLNEKAGNINQVVTTISKVADQTNLLSLNAAIEAEKAGEHGRGFAVVATEIRRLADQTAVATYDIGQMVKEIQSAVSSSVMGMDKFSEEVRRGMDDVQKVSGQLSQIIHEVQALAPRVEAVNEGMQAQATGAEQITQALVQLNEAAQQTVESLRQSSMAVDELHEVANALRGGVSRFKLQA